MHLQSRSVSRAQLWNPQMSAKAGLQKWQHSPAPAHGTGKLRSQTATLLLHPPPQEAELQTQACWLRVRVWPMWLKCSEQSRPQASPAQAPMYATSRGPVPHLLHSPDLVPRAQRSLGMLQLSICIPVAGKHCCKRAT